MASPPRTSPIISAGVELSKPGATNSNRQPGSKALSETAHTNRYRYKSHIVPASSAGRSAGFTKIGSFADPFGAAPLGLRPGPKPAPGKAYFPPGVDPKSPFQKLGPRSLYGTGT